MYNTEFSNESEKVLLHIMDTVEFLLSYEANPVSDYFPDWHDTNFYKDSRLILRHQRGDNHFQSYDLRRACDVTNLRFSEAPEADLGYEFDFDDRFVLAYRKGYGSNELFAHIIVLGYDGSARLHKRYFESHGQGEITDCSAEEAHDILSGVFNRDATLEPCNILESPDPQLRALGLDVYHRSLRPDNG